MVIMMDVYKWYYLSRWLYLHHVPLLPFILKALIRIIWAAVIPYQADIGKGTILGYQGLGMVIHKRCIIGENCHLSQNVTLGGQVVTMRCQNWERMCMLVQGQISLAL